MQKYNSSDALRANTFPFDTSPVLLCKSFLFMPFSKCNSPALTAGLFSLLESEDKELAQDKGCLALDGPSGRKLLKEILEEVKAARQKVKTEETNTGPGYYRRVAGIIDAVFFAFYLITIITFLSIMSVTWFGQ